MTQQGSHSRPLGANCPLLPRGPGQRRGPPGRCGGWARTGGRCGQGEPGASACLEAAMREQGLGRCPQGPWGQRALERSLCLVPEPSPVPAQWELPYILPAPRCPELSLPLVGWCILLPAGPTQCRGKAARVRGLLWHREAAGPPPGGSSAPQSRKAGEPPSRRLGRHPRAPQSSWMAPARRGCAGDRNSRGGPLPYLTPRSAALYCPALAGCPAARRAAKSPCQVAYRDPMALDTNWCRLPRMNNVIAGITVKCSHSHPLNAETGPLGPSREHLLQLCPLPAARPVLA